MFNHPFNHPAARDTALLVLRLVLGVVFVAHGWKKVFIDGMNGKDGTIAMFAAMNVPLPRASAWGVASAEVLGGALLVLGLLTTAAAGALMLLFAMVTYFVHLPNGLFVNEGGVEFTLLITVALLQLVIFGAGRASLDHALARR